MSVIDNVPERFRSIPKKVRRSPLFGTTKRYLGANNTLIPWPEYTTTRANRYGFFEHFQGAARVGRRLILSGGIKEGRRGSQLIVIDMGSRQAEGPWAIPEYGHSYKRPHPADASFEVIDIGGQKRWHAGGIQAAEGIVAVPTYGDESVSDIRFVDVVRDPQERIVPTLVKRRTQSKAVGLARLPEGRYGALFLLVVWDDDRLDFHLSETTRLEDGFRPEYTTVPRRDLGPGFNAGRDPAAGTYQSVNLVVDRDQEVYLVTARNSVKPAPYITGKDFLDLHRVRWRDHDLGERPTVTSIDSKQMYCYNQQCNFAAGVGAHVEDADSLWIYAAAHWLHDGNRRFNFNEYAY